MNINTEKFGEISIDDNLIFDFVEPIIGYDGLRQYVLVEHTENSAFKWLQSIERPDLAFPVTSRLLLQECSPVFLHLRS